MSTTTAVAVRPLASRCETCGTEIAAELLACPGCRRLVHAEQLRLLSERAAAAARADDRSAEMEAWNSAIDLLPAGSRQRTVIADKIAALSATAASHERLPAPHPHSRVWKWIAGLGPIGLLAWKLKFLAVAMLANGKLLLLGLTKTSTLLSMLLSLGVYWTAWGMKFALGLVLSLYVHEMGHVVALRRYGIPATAPMFVPGLGAFIRLRQRSLPPFQNARVGLAGPVWGLAAALAAAAVAGFSGGPMWSAIAHTGAWLNLFNLLPVWQLDGARGFSALGRPARGIVAAAFAGAWIATGDSLVALLALASIVRAIDPRAPAETDAGVCLEFVALIAALAFVLRISAIAP